MKHLFNKGDVVNIFQMSFGDGLLFEGKATIVKPVGNWVDEHYMIRFHADVGKYIGPTPTYERFVDREGQTDPEAYIKAFNKKIGKPIRNAKTGKPVTREEVAARFG